MSKNMVFGDVRFRMKRMEWCSEKNKLKENWPHSVSFNVTGMTTDVCHNHQEDLHV